MEKEKIIHIVAGGPRALLPDLAMYKGEQGIYWIGVDKGTRYLFEYGIQPDLAIGDFDSISQEERTAYEGKVPVVKVYEREKDQTDMELALISAMERNPDRIRIFGGTGGRIDHMLANLHLLSLPIKAGGPKTEMIDRQNHLEVKGPGVYTVEKKPDKPYISFIPLSANVERLTLNGFKYPLKDRHISFGSTLCISNELIRDYGTYSFTEGILLVVESSDG